MNKVLLAGATGYLGRYLLRELLQKNFDTSVVVRNEKKLPPPPPGCQGPEVIRAEVTDRASVSGCCNGIDIVISTVGITRQKDGLTYMEVDFQANMNLLEEAKRSGVRKFIYISVFQGDRLTKLKICAAKEKFVQALKSSGLDYCVIRPTGYFSDMKAFLDMARKGRVFLFGKGNNKMNPIHGADLAAFCAGAIASADRELAVGGPQTFTFRRIAELAFEAAGKKTRITFIPGWVSKAVLCLLRTFTSSKFYGPVEFLITVLTRDMTAPARGTRTLKAYFERH